MDLTKELVFVENVDQDVIGPQFEPVLDSNNLEGLRVDLADPF